MRRTIILLAALCSMAFVASDATVTHRDRIECVYQGSPANYQLYIFGGDSLRCRGTDLHISRDERSDGDGPIVVECR